MNIDHGGETLYTAQYHKAFLMYVENEYYAKHLQLLVIKPEDVPSDNLFPSVIASGSCQSWFDKYG